MSLVLYGSKPSPYVRRIRLLLADHPFELREIELYQDDTRAAYAHITPLRKLPVLVDGAQTVFDSHVIHQYLCERLQLPPLTFAQHNLVSAADAVTDALILLLLAQRSGLDTHPEQLLFKLQLERLPDCLDWLEDQAKAGAFDAWHYATMALISAMDWAEFRNLYQFDRYPALCQARTRHAQRDCVLATRP